MTPVELPVLQVQRREILRFYDEQILGVLFLGSAGEVVGAGDDGRAVYHHYLVMGNGVLAVDERGNAGIGEERRGGISLGPLALVEYRLHLDAPFVSIDQGLSDRGAREGIGLHEDFGPGPAYLLDDGLRCSPVGREIHLHRGVVEDEVVGVGAMKAQEEKGKGQEDDRDLLHTSSRVSILRISFS